MKTKTFRKKVAQKTWIVCFVAFLMVNPGIAQTVKFSSGKLSADGSGSDAATVLKVSQESFRVTLARGGSTTKILTIQNLGTLTLNWEISLKAAERLSSPEGDINDVKEAEVTDYDEVIEFCYSNDYWCDPVFTTDAESIEISGDLEAERRQISPIGAYPLPLDATCLNSLNFCNIYSHEDENLEGTAEKVSTSTTSTSRTVASETSSKSLVTFADHKQPAGWLSATVSSGTVPTQSSVDIEIIFDAKNLNSGDHKAIITLTSVDPNSSEIIVPVHLTVDNTTASEDDAMKQIPDEFKLMQNYPNPFNPETEIRFQLPEAAWVVIRIFNALGQEVRTLTNGRYEAGFHSLSWNGKHENGVSVSSGVYLYRFETDKLIQAKKMLLLR